MTPDQIITAIVTDLRNRKGLGDEWDNIDADIRKEIVAEWRSYFPASGEALGECICKGNWRAIVKHYEPKIGFRYKDNRGVEYVFFGLVHAEDDYYYGLMSDDGKVRLATCVGSLDDMYEQIPNGGRCDLCNVVYPASGPEKCDRYRCPQGDYPLSRSEEKDDA